MVVYVLTFKKFNNERDTHPQLPILAIDSNLKHLYQVAADYLQKQAKDYPSLGAFLYTYNNWHEGTNLILVHQDGEQIKAENVIWSKLLFNGVAASKIIKDEKQKTLSAEQKSKQAEIDLKVQLKRNIAKLSLPTVKASDKLAYAFINLNHYKQVLDDDLDEIDYYHGDDFMADTYLRNDQIEADNDLMLWDEPYALLVGENTAIKDRFGELGKQGATIYHFFNENNCIVSLTEIGLKKAAEQYKGVDPKFDEWLKRAMKLDWPKGLNHDALCSIGHAMPNMMSNANVSLTDYIKQDVHCYHNIFEIN